jgi:hypothetical protein
VPDQVERIHITHGSDNLQKFDAFVPIIESLVPKVTDYFGIYGYFITGEIFTKVKIS